MQYGNTLVVLPTGLGKCLEFSQPVLLADGTLKKIGELFENSKGEVIKNKKNHITIRPKKALKVISLNNDLKLEKRKAIAIHKIKAGKNLLKITTAAGAEIIVTPEHPLLTLEKELKWKRADRFNNDDFVAVPAFLPEPPAKDSINIIKVFTKINSNVICFVGLNKVSAKKFGDNKQEQKLNELVKKTKRLNELNKGIMYIYIRGGKTDQTPIKAVRTLSPDLFYWAGLVIAEGSSYGSLKFYNEDEGLLKIFSEITQRIFNLTPKRITGGLRVASSALHFFARNLFGIKNQHSRDKTITDTVMSTSNKNAASFISGLYDGEGSVRKDGLIELITASSELAHKLCYLLLRFGIKARIKKKICSATNSPNPKKREYYRVYIEGVKDLKIFKEKIGFRHKEKQKKLEQYLNKKITYNPNFNLVPISGKLVREIREHLGLSSTKWKDFKIPGIDIYERSERKFSHNTLKKTIAGFEAKEGNWNSAIREKITFLKRLLGSHIYWDRVKSIKKVKEEWVYDLTLDANFNFIAGMNGGFISHNTLIALMLIREKLKQGRCLFLTPTKPLAKQHFDSVKEILELDDEQVSLVTGEMAPAKRKTEYSKDIIISTPQTIRNDMLNDRFGTNFKLVIFDEAHRAIGDYAYTYIAEKLKDEALYVALTASPGGRRDRIQEVLSNLYIENIEIRSSTDSDVSPYVQKSTITWIPIELSPTLKLIKRELDTLASKYARRLGEMGFPPPMKHKGKFLEMRKRILAIPSGIKYPAMVQYSVLLHVLHMSELLETQGVFPLKKYITKVEEKESKSAKLLLKEPGLAKIRELGESGAEHPKLKKLIEILGGMKGKKVIVFAQYRDQIKQIEELLNEAGISAKQFVGKRDGVTRKMQEATIAEFREGKFDVLCASSIGEEGLDIPKVDSVIFYEPIPSEIRSIQRRGRAARFKEGEIFILMTKDTRDEAYHYASKRKEEKMKNILSSMQRKMRGEKKNGNRKPKTGNATKTQDSERSAVHKTRLGQTKMKDFL
jgi:ERCC4-related helicase